MPTIRIALLNGFTSYYYYYLVAIEWVPLNYDEASTGMSHRIFISPLAVKEEKATRVTRDEERENQSRPFSQ